MTVTTVSPTEYGLALGALLVLRMEREGWISGEGPDDINEQRCRDIVAVVAETDWLTIKDPADEEEGVEAVVAVQLATSILIEGGMSNDDARKITSLAIEKFGFTSL